MKGRSYRNRLAQRDWLGWGILTPGSMYERDIWLSSAAFFETNRAIDGTSET
jgi:hypothetical protein